MNVFRAALTSDFWMTGIAIVRYIPRWLRVKQVDGNLFTTTENLGGRLERENCGRLEAPSNVWQDEANGVGQALADSRGLSPETVRSLTE